MECSLEVKVPRKYESRLPIPEKKYNGLIELCEKLVIPIQFHPFYRQLPHGKYVVANDDDDDDDRDYRGESDDEI